MNLKPFRFLKRSKVVLPVIILLGLSTTSARNANEEVTDRRTILIIPFAPSDFRAVGSEFICTASDINPGEFSDKIRNTVTKNCFLSFANYYQIPVKIINDKPHDGDPSDYTKMLSIVESQNKWKKLESYDRLYPWKIFKTFSGPEKKYGTDCLNGGGGYPSDFHSYYKTIIKDTDEFVTLTIKYRVGYVLFLDHFEMNTRFRNCLDMEESVYQRDFYLHYSLYDDGGLYVSGGTVGVTCQNNSNDYQVALQDNIEYLTDMVCSKVRPLLE